MRSSLSCFGLLAISSSALWLAACGGSIGAAGPCDGANPAPSCAQTCDATTPCPGGYYCAADGTCNADCTQGGTECGNGKACSPDGHCIADNGDGGGCPGITVNLTPVVPTVILLIDQSGSMDMDFMGASRWDSVKTALTDATNGVLPKLDARLMLGASLYTSNGGTAGGTCPELTSTADIKTGNAAEVDTLLANNNPVQDTPTAESVTATVPQFTGYPEPHILVLATDGDPDTCADPNSNGQPGPKTGSENAVKAAFTAGVKTFVLGVGNDATAAHLDRLARAGQGQDLTTGAATAFTANTPAELATAFGTIIGGATSCDVDINGTVDLSKAAEGTVTLDGNVLTYGTDWTMLDTNTLRLLGASCTEYLSATNVNLSAEFACGGVVVD